MRGTSPSNKPNKEYRISLVILVYYSARPEQHTVVPHTGALQWFHVLSDQKIFKGI